MTTAEKITQVQTLLGNDEEATDELISAYLEMAKAEILNVRYPFGVPLGAEVPCQYNYSQILLAQRYFLRRGAEGEILHNEDGVHRHYGTVDDRDILGKIVPIVRVG